MGWDGMGWRLMAWVEAEVEITWCEAAHSEDKSADGPPDHHEEGKCLRHREREVLVGDGAARKLSGTVLAEGKE